MSLKNGWTGGQYSLFRIIFATYLFIHFAQLIPWASELFSDAGVLPNATVSPIIRYLPFFPNMLAWSASGWVMAVLVAATAACLLLALGYYDRLAALFIWYVWACLFGRNPLILNPGLPFVGWLLLAHACMPSAPYGSWAGRGRADPGGGWEMPQSLFAAAWILMALGYSYSGYTKLVSPSWVNGNALARVLNNPLARPGPIREMLLMVPDRLLQFATWGALAFELGFAPLALVRIFRPWLWGLMLLMHFSLIVLIDFADLSLGMIMVHLFTFNPAWVKPLKAPIEMIFYDGHCGLCHRAVRFILAEDRMGATFRFAPLDSDAFRAIEPPGALLDLQTVVVHTSQGDLLTRSTAVLYIARRLGGIWRVLGAMCRLVPSFIRDGLYSFIAKVRHRIFARPAQTCPLIPAHLRPRFDM